MGQAPPLDSFWCSSHVSVPFRAGHASGQCASPDRQPQATGQK